MDSAEQRLVRAFETVFPDLPAERVRTASQDTVETWDSVAAITLINVIEEEFEIQMDFDDVAESDVVSGHLEIYRGTDRAGGGVA